MTNCDQTYKLLTWLSPSFPVGAYAYSHGVEFAIEHGLVTDADSATAWLSDLITEGSGQVDLVLMAHAYEITETGDALDALLALGSAFWPSVEIRKETLAQGDAFLRTIRTCWPAPIFDALEDEALPYPIIVGLAARAHGLTLVPAMTGFAHAFVANLASAIVRLIPLGQTDGQRVTAALQSPIAVAVPRAADTSLDDIASTTMVSDICSMQHETQYTRLFRS